MDKIKNRTKLKIRPTSLFHGKNEPKIKKGRNSIIRSEWKSFRCKKKNNLIFVEFFTFVMVSLEIELEQDCAQVVGVPYVSRCKIDFACFWLVLAVGSSCLRMRA